MENKADSRRNVVVDPRTIELIERVVHDEARGEGPEGRNAVRAVIYNRLAANRKDFGGGTVLGVLNAPKQFQGVMEKGKGDVRRLSMPDDVREAYMQEHVDFLRSGVDPTNGATFFQNPGAAKNPYKADGGKRIGNHIFYDNYRGNKVEVPEFAVALRGYGKGTPEVAPQDTPEVTGKVPEQVASKAAAQGARMASAAAMPDFLKPLQGPEETVDQATLNRQVPNPRATASPEQSILAQRGPQRQSGIQRIQTASELNPLQMAKGGLIKNEEDMKTNKFACGGMMAPEVIVGYEEESGNEIPYGSTASEVADDIPVMMSEGEVVLPGDVVRWHGLKHIMDMRQEAKMGLMAMAMEGQIQTYGEDEGYDEEQEETSYETPEGNEVDIAQHEVTEEEMEYDEDEDDLDYSTDTEDLVGDEELILVIRKEPAAFKRSKY